MNKPIKRCVTFLAALLLARFAVLHAADAPPPSRAEIAKRDGQYIVTGETYQAVVPASGLLSQLKVPHESLYWVKEFIARPLAIKIDRDMEPGFICPDIAQPEPNVLVCTGAVAVVRYEFLAREVVCRVTSRSSGDMRFLFTLSDNIEGIHVVTSHDEKRLAQGLVLTSYGTRELKALYAGQVLRLTGSMTLYARGLINWAVSPQKTQALTFHVEPATSAERELFAVPPVYKEPLTVFAPLDWQVFQRRTRTEGPIALRGRCALPCDRLEYRLTGPSLMGDWRQEWSVLPMNPVTHEFAAAVTTPAGGWYRGELRALKEGKVVASHSIEHIGVGEVFVVAGQSNSTNNGQEKLSPLSGLVSTFSGDDWRPADDPQPGVHDSSFRGSFFPPLGDALAQRFKVPIGFASTGHGGTSVVHWYPAGELFNWMETRILQLGPQGFRALLWHQGESDGATPATEYRDRLKAVIEESNRRAGWSFPWMVALATGPGGPRDGQLQLWADGAAVPGPDTELLREYRDDLPKGGKGAHYIQAKPVYC